MHLRSEAHLALLGCRLIGGLHQLLCSSSADAKELGQLGEREAACISDVAGGLGTDGAETRDFNKKVFAEFVGGVERGQVIQFAEPIDGGRDGLAHVGGEVVGHRTEISRLDTPRQCIETSVQSECIATPIQDGSDMRIKLSEIEAGDWVDLRDRAGNQASGSVLLDAAHGWLAIEAFGVIVPFALIALDGVSPVMAVPGVEIFSHTEQMFRAAS